MENAEADTAPQAPPATVERKKYLVFAALFTISLAADQVTKIWARSSLKGHPPITVIEGFFDFRYSENPGSAFGLFRNVAGARWLLLGIGLIAMGVVVSLLRKVKPNQLRLAAELGLLAGGALGNIIDRVASGVVTDFVLWKIHQHEWPVFNVADAALVVGVIALLFDMKGDKEPPKKTDIEKPSKKRK
ncbi:MAG: signal peptidase II [Myxococcales bacterium]|nr:signal peptidase II [Myxococcales bacterium]